MGGRKEAGGRQGGNRGTVVTRLLLGLAGVPSAIFLHAPAMMLWLALFASGGVVGAAVSWSILRRRGRAPSGRRLHSAGHSPGYRPRAVARCPAPGRGAVYIGRAVVRTSDQLRVAGPGRPTGPRGAPSTRVSGRAHRPAGTGP